MLFKLLLFSYYYSILFKYILTIIYNINYLNYFQL